MTEASPGRGARGWLVKGSIRGDLAQLEELALIPGQL
jgi:hypothetical protein